MNAQANFDRYVNAMKRLREHAAMRDQEHAVLGAEATLRGVAHAIEARDGENAMRLLYAGFRLALTYTRGFFTDTRGYLPLASDREDGVLNVLNDVRDAYMALAAPIKGGAFFHTRSGALPLDRPVESIIVVAIRERAQTATAVALPVPDGDLSTADVSPRLERNIIDVLLEIFEPFTETPTVHLLLMDTRPGDADMQAIARGKVTPWLREHMITAVMGQALAGAEA